MRPQTRLTGLLESPIGTAIAYFIVAAATLWFTKGVDGIATMWPASGLLLAALLRAPEKPVSSYLAPAAIASALANLTAGSGVAESLGFTFANMVEAAIAIWLLRRGPAEFRSLARPGGVVRFSFSVVVAATVSTMIATLVAEATAGTLSTKFAISWFTTDVLGMLFITPVLLTSAPHIAAGRQDAGIQWRALASLCVMTVVTFGTFAQTSYPLLFLPMLALIATTYWVGPFGAVSGALIVAVIASVLTHLGYGPVSLMKAPIDEASLFLQFYLLVMFLGSLPFAALLANRERLSEQLAQSERMYRLLAEHSSDMISRIGLDGVRRYVSPASKALLGYEPEELVGLSPAGAIHPDDRAHVIETCNSLLTGAAAPTNIYRERRKDGTYVWLEATYRLVRDPASGEPVEFVASVRDSSQRRASELARAESRAQLQESNRLLQMAEGMAQVGHWRVDTNDQTLYWSDEVFRIHGVPIGVPPPLPDALCFYHPDDKARVEAYVQQVSEQGGEFHFEARIVRPSGEIRHILSHGQAELAPDGMVLGLFGVVRDISQQVQIESDLRAARRSAEIAARKAQELAETDELTGIANRRKTLHQLRIGLRAARTLGTSFSIAIFDIDHFKSVNDRFGHAMGDEVLKRLVVVAGGVVRPDDLVGRLGGEEFAVIMPGADAKRAAAIAERLRAAIEADVDGTPVPVTISIGVATATATSTETSLINSADGALYDAKRGGRNRLRQAA